MLWLDDNATLTSSTVLVISAAAALMTKPLLELQNHVANKP
jgi:hypothetical protein